MAINITTPVGRIVQGELWKPMEQKDNKGVVKLGPDGKPLVDYYFALAIPKNPGESHWGQTAWGRQIWEEGHRAHPTFAPHPGFSWKIEDGDSVVPNKKGKKNCDREGFPGNWILKFRSGFAIPTYNADGTAPLAGEAFKTGYFAQVFTSIKGNTGETPGIYMNPQMVALSGYGPEIINTPDASEAGFGAAPLPAGASALPPAAAAPFPGAAPAPLGLPGVAVAVPGLPLTPAGGVSMAPPVAPPAATFPSSPVAVAPNPAFLAGPGGVAGVAAPVVGMPSPPPAPPVAAPIAPPSNQMTAKAGGATYEQFIANGWTAEAMRAEGYLV